MAQDVTLDVGVRLDKIERQMNAVFSRSRVVDVTLSPTSISKLRSQVDFIFNRSSIKLTNIDIAGSVARGIKTGLQAALNQTPLYINNIKLGPTAAASLRASVQQVVGTPRSSSNIVLPSSRRGGGKLPLGHIGGEVSEFSKSLDAATARVTAFGATAVIFYSVARALRELVTSTIEVDKALTDINVLLNLSSSDLQKFGGDLFDIAKKTATGFDDVANAALEFSRQGLNAEETLKRITAAQNLVRLSGIESTIAVEGLTTALNSYAKEGLTAAEVTDKLAAVDAVAATSAGGLVQGLSRVGSAAADAGVEFNDLLGIIASAKQITGRSESVIGNSLKTIFTRLDRTKVREALGGVIDIGENEGAVSILQKLAKNYDSLSNKQKSYISEITAGVFQINQFKAIMSDLGSEFSIYDRSVKAAENSTGLADKRVKDLNESLSSLLQIAGSNLKQDLAGLGSNLFEDQLRGGLKQFNFISDLINNSGKDGSSDGEKLGLKIGQSILKGIGASVTGPGAFLVASVAFRLLKQVSTFTVQNLKTLIGLNEGRLIVENQILATMQAQNGVLSSQVGLTQAGNASAGTSVTTKTSRLGRGTALGVGLAAPFIGEGISNFIGSDSPGTRQGGSILQGLGNVIGYGATGAALGGPIAGGLAATAAALFSFDDILTSFVSDLPDVQKRFNNVSDNLNKFNTLTESVLTLQSSYDGLLQDVQNGAISQKQLNKAQQNLTKEVTKLPATLRDKFLSAKTFDEKRGILNEESARQQQLVNLQGKSIDFSSLFEGAEKKKIYSEIARGFYTLLGSTPLGAIVNLQQGGGLNPFKNATDIVTGLGGDFSGQLNTSDFATGSKLKEIANNIIENTDAASDSLLFFAKKTKTVSDILSQSGIKIDTDLGRFLTKLQESPDALTTFIQAYRKAAFDLGKAGKEAQQKVEDFQRGSLSLALPKGAFFADKNADDATKFLKTFADTLQETTQTLGSLILKPGGKDNFASALSRSSARRQQGANDEQFFNLLGLSIAQQQKIQGKYTKNQSAANQGLSENRIIAANTTEQVIGGILEGTQLSAKSGSDRVISSSEQLQSQINKAIEKAIQTNDFSGISQVQKQISGMSAVADLPSKALLETVSKYLEAFVTSMSSNRPLAGAANDVAKIVQQKIETANINAANAIITIPDLGLSFGFGQKKQDNRSPEEKLINQADKYNNVISPTLPIDKLIQLADKLSVLSIPQVITNNPKTQQVQNAQSMPEVVTAPPVQVNINIAGTDENIDSFLQDINNLAVNYARLTDRVVTVERKTNTIPPPPSAVIGVP